MRALCFATAAVLLLTGNVAAQASGPTQLQWIPVPPILPPGALIAVVSGDPTGPGRCMVELAITYLHEYDVPRSPSFPYQY